MSTPLNSARRGALATLIACGLGLIGLAVSGCSNHGPVGLFSEELFNKSIGGPNLTFYSASSVSITTFVEQYPGTPNGPGDCTTCYTGVQYFDGLYESNGTPAGRGPYLTGYYSLSVVLVNNGGSGTYGPVQVTFTASDPNMFFHGSGPTTGADLSDKGCNAISEFGSGSEILPSSQTQVPLVQGYVGPNNTLNDDNANFSLQFYYTFNSNTAVGGGYDCNCSTPSYITVPINMTITDGIGNTYYSSFDLYITQNPNDGTTI
jgi:hypothetical protein